MGQGELKYHPGIPRVDTNNQIIPYFLTTIKQKDPRFHPLNPQQYRDSVVEFLEEYPVPIRGRKQHLPFQVEETSQASIDLANRVIFLARKIAVTTREKDIPSYFANGKEVFPQDYLHQALFLLSQFSENTAIEAANEISSILSVDPDHNLTPFLFAQGFQRMITAYQQRAKELTNGSEQFRQLTLGGLRNTKKYCEWVSGETLTQADKVVAARGLLDRLNVPY